MIGILLAGGHGTRLRPITNSISKQLLPIYDKPMIYYPLSLLMAAKVRDFQIITTALQETLFRDLLKDGSQWGISIQFVTQAEPTGIPEAFLLTRKKILGRKTIMSLGDNLFYGSQMGRRLSDNSGSEGAHIYGYQVNNISSFGSLTVVDNKITKLEEKPKRAGSGFAIPGLYHFDDRVIDFCEQLKPSARGELEIVDLLKKYLEIGKLDYSILDRGTAWLDTGTHEDMFAASELVRVIQTRQGMLVGSPEEVAFRNGWITSTELEKLTDGMTASPYYKSVLDLIKD
jgi:glucose-1-phosphate thymidylyltransferase